MSFRTPKALSVNTKGRPESCNFRHIYREFLDLMRPFRFNPANLLLSIKHVTQTT